MRSSGASRITSQFTEHDPANLDAYRAAVRFVAAGQNTPAFTVRTRPSTTWGSG